MWYEFTDRNEEAREERRGWEKKKVLKNVIENIFECMGSPWSTVYARSCFMVDTKIGSLYRLQISYLKYLRRKLQSIVLAMLAFNKHFARLA